ncbi:DsbA family oxidoreductase [Aspergillus brunneoviolaceus CBS 621.78]|uniref:Thioredoxin-like protein n=1 Tax=Aspergillus brunneoviolaceus CBS 621.78 TaxID=1450534 RepID=A0ACD1GMK0_9EURO|nr:thioredoxin-like protein [Aspergillus brunneoviolaceus CBS 621.78]RAH50503.1 thioredoxin-like protein [Aspergillus brunneoviolaceus CBS 621.78]
MTLINISITSDPVCPWCYIGYRRLTKALRLYQKTYPGGGQDAIRITWKPYILDANAPMESIPYMGNPNLSHIPHQTHDKILTDRSERMTQKLGPEKVPHAQAHLQRLGHADGIHFRFGGRIGSTLPAHQVIMLSQLQDQGHTSESTLTGSDTGVGAAALVEAIFEAHFEREQDITDVETLVRLAGQAGMDERVARSWLAEGRGVAEIQQEALRARDEGIVGVPYFQFGGGERMRSLSGGQEVAEFLEALIAYKEGLEATDASSGVRGVACAGDTC